MKHGKDLAVCGCRLKNYVHLDRREADRVRAWRNTDAVRRWMYRDHRISAAEHAAFLKKLREDRRMLWWLVSRDGVELGVITLGRIDAANGNAYLGLYGNPASAMPGKGKVLMECLKEAAFNILGLHTLKLEVIETNSRAIKLYRQCGFTREGRLKEFVMKDGKRRDVIVMGLLK